MTVIDVHTHMFTTKWLELLRDKSGTYNIQTRPDGQREIFRGNVPVVLPQKGHFDWELRIQHMDQAKVDLSVVSLTCPNVYWGGPEVSLKGARIMNDDMAKAQKSWPDRIRWFASLPWQHEQLALQELQRSCDNGAVGVMVLANIGGKPLTDPQFANIWKEIDRRALPVLVHPTAPPGAAEMGLHEFQLTAPIGFTFDTSLAIARCIYDGFFDRFPKLKLIASHGGGALPYLVGRLDICWDNIPAAHAKTLEPPRNYMRRIYVDSVVFRQDVLDMSPMVCG